MYLAILPRQSNLARHPLKHLLQVMLPVKLAWLSSFVEQSELRDLFTKRPAKFVNLTLINFIKFN